MKCPAVTASSHTLEKRGGPWRREWRNTSMPWRQGIPVYAQKSQHSIDWEGAKVQATATGYGKKGKSMNLDCGLHLSPVWNRHHWKLAIHCSLLIAIHCSLPFTSHFVVQNWERTPVRPLLMADFLSVGRPLWPCSDQKCWEYPLQNKRWCKMRPRASGRLVAARNHFGFRVGVNSLLQLQKWVQKCS